jgi:phospholipid/cholesterol/gamma-HCH transport system substrate-binding protein
LSPPTSSPASSSAAAKSARSKGRPCWATPRSEEYIEDGDQLTGVVAVDPFEAFTDLQATLSESLTSVRKTSDAIGEFMGTVNEEVKKHEGEIYEFIDQAQETMVSLKQTVDNVNELIADEEVRADLKDAIARLPHVLQETQFVLSDTRDSLALVNAEMSNAALLVEENLEGLRKFTGPLGERGPELVRGMEVNLQRLDLLTEQMLKFSQALNDEQGTISQLVRNPDLYQNLNRTVGNVENLTRRLRPIIDNLYIFSDKIARQPGSLGVRGALERRAGIK